MCVCVWLEDHSSEDGARLLPSFLFPPPATPRVGAAEDDSPPLPVPLFNRELNLEQVNAVRRALNGSLQRTPYVVFGPPGTGKTSTVVELIGQALGGGDGRRRHRRVLVCAPSNAAADMICQRALKHGCVPGGAAKLLRVVAFSRAKKGVPEDLFRCCRWDESQGAWRTPSAEEFWGAQVVAMTCMTAAKYSLSINVVLNSKERFSMIIVDEAGHCPEPECIASFANMLAAGGSVVLAGDHKQLAPIIRSPEAAALKVSLLERLCASGPHSPRPSTASYDDRFVTMLVRNYRSHPAIIELPSEMFYHGKLEPHANLQEVRSLCGWTGLNRPDTDFPILFHGIIGQDMRENNSPSWFNPDEAMAVLRHIESLMRTRGTGLTLSQIGVITPYAKQKEKIRKYLRSKGLDGVTVGTTEEFQGSERRVIIISTTRSDPSMISFDARHHLGFIANPQRFNVAVTRAQALLIVVGNPLLLGHDKCWGALLRHCVRRGGYDGPPLSEELLSEEETSHPAANVDAIIDGVAARSHIETSDEYVSVSAATEVEGMPWRSD